MPPIGFHVLKDFQQRGAAWWKARYIDKTIQPRPSSAAQVIGTAVHAIALEGREKLDAGFTTAPAGDWENADRRMAQDIAAGREPLVVSELPNRRTKVGKEAWAVMEAQAAGRPIMPASERERLEPLVCAYRVSVGKVLLAASDFDAVCRMGQAVRNHPEAMRLLEGSAVEVELEGDVEVETLLGAAKITVRGRLDIAGRSFVADLKTTDDLSQAAFDRSIANYEYHRQLAFYDLLRELAGEDSDDMEEPKPNQRAFIIGVETPEAPEDPVRVEVMALSDDYLAIGQRENYDAIASLYGTFATDAWSPLAAGVRQVVPPRWKL